MQTTMNLLAIAQQKMPTLNLSDWADNLGLSKRALYTAKDRQHLSPAIAGVLAERLGEDVEKWIVIAALESEKDSACKSHLLKRMSKAFRES